MEEDESEVNKSFEEMVHNERRKRILSNSKSKEKYKHDTSPLQLMRESFRKLPVPKLETPSVRESKQFMSVNQQE